MLKDVEVNSTAEITQKWNSHIVYIFHALNNSGFPSVKSIGQLRFWLLNSLEARNIHLNII